jgi:RNA polymerase sigma-70 factor (ECF subfamily)
VRPPRKGGRRPPAAKYEPAFPEPQVVIAEAWRVREHLRRRGVLDVDLDDVMQETMVGAVVAVSRGRYRPNPALPPRKVLRRWILGISLRQLTHLQQRAHRRREVLSGAAGEEYDAASPSLEARTLAWETLGALAQLRPERRDVLALTALGMTMKEVGAYLGVNPNTVATRLRYARRDLARILRRGGR